MDNNFRDKVKQIQKECRTTLYIGRVPEKVKTKFKQWCNEEFEGDYGMGLKWLWDFKEGLLSNPNQVLSDKIDFLADQVTRLQEEKPKKPKRKMLSGREFEEVEKNVETK